jgi:uncharacterized protein (DUF2147 family)
MTSPLMEASMKTLYFAASLLIASTAAHAGSGISFQIDGRKVHIEAPKNCSSLDCVQITGTGISGSGLNLKSLKSKLNNDDDQIATTSNPPAQKTAPAAAPQAPAPAPVATTPPPAPVTEASTANAPLLHDVTPSTASPVLPPATATAATTPAQTAATTPASTAPDAQPAATTDATATPVGLWATQDNKGNVQIEQCGQNLCGYSEKNREPILINMKPSNNKWTGRIHDPEGGSNYDSTIALKGPNTLKVQGCAFGGLFCGGQTWKRIS